MDRSQRSSGWRRRSGWATSLGTTLLAAGIAGAAAPNHPRITEAYQKPPGNDGPVTRTLSNRDQEFVEIYLPLASNLRPGLNKDAVRLALYDVEGDVVSTSIGRVNRCIDRPTIDLDPNNGLTPGALPRPPSGAVVIGWVDHLGNPPIDLAGTPSTRVALVDGGGTTNFATRPATCPSAPGSIPRSATATRTSRSGPRSSRRPSSTPGRRTTIRSSTRRSSRHSASASISRPCCRRAVRSRFSRRRSRKKAKAMRGASPTSSPRPRTPKGSSGSPNRRTA